MNFISKKIKKSYFINVLLIVITLLSSKYLTHANPINIELELDYDEYENGDNVTSVIDDLQTKG